MAKARRSHRTLTTLVVLVLLSITIITLDERGGTHDFTSGLRSVANDVFHPLVAGVNDVLRPIGDFFAGAVHYGSLQQELQQADATIGQLKQDKAVGAYAEEQLAQIDALKRLPWLGSLTTVDAATIELSPSNFDADITIDKGRDDGVTVGEPVVGAGGLVGQVTYAYHSTAIVQLVTDGQSSVGVAFGKGLSLSGTVQGQGPGKPLAVDFVAPGTPLRVGEVLYTNSLAGAEYPPGIPVGTVASYRTATGASQISVTARPSADLDQLAYVAVIEWEPPT